MTEGVKLTKASCTRTTWRDWASIAAMALLTLLNAASPHPTPWLLIMGGLGCGLLAGTMWRDEWWKHRLKNPAGRAALNPESTDG